MTTDIRRISIPKGRRVIAISDIHGHKQLLVELHDKIGFCRDDELFIIGDLLARGPDSLGSLRYAMELAQRPNVHVMMGNMEYWHYHLIQNDTPEGHSKLRKQINNHLELFGHAFFAEMLEELGIPFTDDLDMAEAAAAIRRGYLRELAFMASLPVIVETDHLIFVHGGIPSQDLEAFRDTDPHQYLKNDNFMEQGISFSKYVIVGHWPVTNYYRDHICHTPVVNHEQRLISIDGGCGIKTGAQLNAFILQDESVMEYTVEYCDGLPVRIAAEDQEESKTHLNIRFGDHALTILKDGDEECYVEHKSTGARLWIPKGNIWYEGEQACGVHSDYRLPVERGEPLSIYQETDHGCMVKKNGLCGWYYGSFLEPSTETTARKVNVNKR